MERRAFLRAGLERATDAAVSVAEQRLNERAKRWIRPPFALNELDFLLACTRCDKCIEACPHDVIFSLSANLGADVTATPALDLLNKGCHMCEDWPCVDVCEDNALVRDPNSQDDEPSLPLLATVTIDTAVCLPYNGPECGACRPACPVPGAMLWHREKPEIVAADCTGCGLCREACIVEPKAVLLKHRAKVIEEV